MEIKNNGIEILLNKDEEKILMELLGGLSRDHICKEMELSVLHNDFANDLHGLLDRE